MKKIKQISVFIENKQGRLANVTKILARANINVRALSVADTSDFGILRMIVNDPDVAYRHLKEEGFVVSMTEVIAVKIADRPGALNELLETLFASGLNLEYMYAFCGADSGSAINVIRVDLMDEVCKLLADKNVEILSGDVVYNL